MKIEKKHKRYGIIFRRGSITFNRYCSCFISCYIDYGPVTIKNYNKLNFLIQIELLFVKNKTKTKNINYLIYIYIKTFNAKFILYLLLFFIFVLNLLYLFLLYK